MAIYRAIHTTFWNDTKVLDDMDIEERYFMLYLLTNPHSNQVGCFEISKRQMCNETGFDLKKISTLLEKFENELNIIAYSNKTKELFICNWYKYNWSKSPKVKSCIEKELKSIKSQDLQERIKDIFNSVYNSKNGYPIDTLSIPYEYPMDSLVEVYANKNNNNNNKNNNKNKNKKNNKNNNNNKKASAGALAGQAGKNNSFPFYSLCEIIEIGQSEGIDETLCQKFYDYYEPRGWLTTNGEEIKNVKALLKKWSTQNKKAKVVIDMSEEGIKNDVRRIFGSV